MAELILQSYWWPRIHVDIRQYVDSCDICQHTKTIWARPCGTLALNQIPSHPWQYISVDLITELPTSQGYDAILVVVNWFTKMICLIPTYTTLSSEGVACLFQDHVWKDFGIPENIIYDQGSIFISKFIEALNGNHLLGIQANPSTVYHPQTDGQTEWVNQEVEQYLHIFINYHQDNWVDWLSLAEFSHNDKINTSTHQSPFYLNWGCHLRKGVKTKQETWVEAAKNFVERMEGIRKETGMALEQAAQDMMNFYDRHHQEAPVFQLGDKVLLEGENLHTNRPSKKLDHHHFGPFKIDKKVGEWAY